MILLKSDDLFQARLKSLIADYDRDTVVNLYQPLVGYSAIALYFSLWSEANNQKLTSLSTHENLLIRMQMQTSDFLKARKSLEAIGLLKTYMEKGEDINVYAYELYSPKTPWEFFDDPLLYGLLIKSLGEADANRLKSIYRNDKSDINGEDVSSSFGEIFHPDFEDSSFSKAVTTKSGDIKGRRKAKATIEFNLEEFFNALKAISQLNENSFSKDEIKAICKLSALYGVNEEVTAHRVSNLYDVHKPKGERIDSHDLANDLQNEVSFNFLNRKSKKKQKGLVSNDSDLANKINLLETVSPKEFLTIMQNGTIPAPSDLWLIYDLSMKYKLSNGVINVILDYVLNVKNNVLSRSMSEKIAASLARASILTALDAMNFINDNIATGKIKEANHYLDSQKVVQQETNGNQEEMKNDESKWNKLLSDYNEDDK